ncbi:hypothetical protein [Dickeya ananatis]|uniref:hypothetical protein n=1 Tax=Dickeya ananatis TaxID=3061286 RepID=UPI00388F404C
MNLIIERILNEPNNITIDIDGYVPLDIKFSAPIGLPPLYWRVGDGKKSLLELAVLPESGSLSDITLVMLNPCSIQKVDSIPVKLSDDKLGNPIINLDSWNLLDRDEFSQRFIDDFDLDIKAVISPTSILLIIDGSNKITDWIKCSDTFYVGTNDKRNITHLFLDKLTQEEIERFYEAIG